VDFPLAIRYPRGRGTIINWQMPFEKIEIGKGEEITDGDHIAVLSIGTIGNTIKEVVSELEQYKIGHYNMRFVKPLDEKLLHTIFKKYKTVVTVENGTIIGGFGTSILEFSSMYNYRKTTIKQLGIPDTFIEHGETDELLNKVHLSKDKIKEFLLQLI